ncbi:hypothetical protein J6590_013225 [Homalodisca vitripennis]|nr:hypothetical protein J6590_013225 [Homalodisca vitripennis]
MSFVKQECKFVSVGAEVIRSVSTLDWKSCVWVEAAGLMCGRNETPTTELNRVPLSDLFERTERCRVEHNALRRVKQNEERLARDKSCIPIRPTLSSPPRPAPPPATAPAPGTSRLDVARAAGHRDNSTNITSFKVVNRIRAGTVMNAISPFPPRHRGRDIVKK